MNVVELFQLKVYYHLIIWTKNQQHIINFLLNETYSSPSHVLLLLLLLAFWQANPHATNFCFIGKRIVFNGYDWNRIKLTCEWIVHNIQSIYLEFLFWIPFIEYCCYFLFMYVVRIKWIKVSLWMISNPFEKTTTTWRMSIKLMFN